MKKNVVIGIAVAIVMGFTACEKGFDAKQQESEILITETFSAGFDQEQTKTSISAENKVNWELHDKIRYYTADGGNLRDFEITSIVNNQAELTLKRESSDTYYNLVYAGTYPATISSPKSQTSMILTEGVDSEQDGTFANANISVASSTPGLGSVTFKPVSALVKFTTERTDIKTIILTGGAGTESVAGNVSVNPTADSPIAALSGTGLNKITVTIGTPAAGTYYINVLPQTYSKGLTLTLKDASGSVIGSVVASKTINLSAGGKMINLGNIDNHISGLFSVSATKKVCFSKGNLYWDGSAWHFEDKQSDYNSSYSSTWSENKHISHFYWTTDAAASYAKDYSVSSKSKNDNFFASGSDVNHKLTVDGTSGWYTLSQSEWAYLLNKSNAKSGARTQTNRFARARVNGVIGLLIFPDEYNGTEKVSCDGIVGVNESGTVTLPENSISDATWSSMELAGVVFLPTPGYRNGSGVTYAGTNGYVLSSSTVTSGTTSGSGYYYIYFLSFSSTTVNPALSNYRHYGRSIRLVR